MLKKRLKKFLRKQKHKRYVNRYLAETRWDIINYVVSSSATGITRAGEQHLENMGTLIRKYERRRRWLRF